MSKYIQIRKAFVGVILTDILQAAPSVKEVSIDTVKDLKSPGELSILLPYDQLLDNSVSDLGYEGPSSSVPESVSLSAVVTPVDFNAQTTLIGLSSNSSVKRLRKFLQLKRIFPFRSLDRERQSLEINTIFFPILLLSDWSSTWFNNSCLLCTRSHGFTSSLQ